MLRLAPSFILLQRRIGFQHRDLHHNNVMSKERAIHRVITLKTGTDTLTYTSFNRTFIIDIDQCCIDATKWDCGVPIKTHIQATSRDTWNKCDDNNNDFHMLLTSIAGKVSKIKDLEQQKQYKKFFKSFPLHNDSAG